MEKGATAQPSCALFCRLYHVLLGEAIDPVGFGAPGRGGGGTGRNGAARVEALERELERATSETSVHFEAFSHEARYHLERLKTGRGQSQTISNDFRTISNDYSMSHLYDGSVPWLNIPRCSGPVVSKGSGGGLFGCFSPRQGAMSL